MRIVVHTPEAAVRPLIHSEPRTGLQGKFSLEYAVTAALLDGHPGFVSYTDGYVERPLAQRLIGLVETVRTPEGSGLLTGDTSVEITIGDGTVLRTTLALPPGSPEHPATEKEFATKLADCEADVPRTARRPRLEGCRTPHARHFPRTPSEGPRMSPLPLEGITVVSLEQAVAAPFATRQLADLGARVIKVERPGPGDFARGYDESVHGQSSYFVWLNRSKESLTLDIKTPAGREVLERLLAEADVFVQNLAPGAARRLGLGAKELAERYPSLVVCDISGYGNTGPWADRKAYDLLVQCETGVVSLTGSPEEPAKVGISIADIAAGMYAYSGILTALYERRATGRARSVEVSLFEALSEWMGSPAYYTAYSGTQPARVGVQHATIAPYGPYSAADGRTVLLAIQNEREWASFCEVFLGDASLAGDPRFHRNSARVARRDELNAIVAARFAELDAAAAVKLLDDAKVANARLNSVEEYWNHPVLSGRDRWRDVSTPGGAIKALLPPATLSGLNPRMDPVPAVGEHTDSVLRGLGYDDTAITALRADGAV